MNPKTGPTGSHPWAKEIVDAKTATSSGRAIVPHLKREGAFSRASAATDQTFDSRFPSHPLDINLPVHRNPTSTYLPKHLRLPAVHHSSHEYTTTAFTSLAGSAKAISHKTVGRFSSRRRPLLDHSFNSPLSSLFLSNSSSMTY